MAGGLGKIPERLVHCAWRTAGGGGAIAGLGVEEEQEAARGLGPGLGAEGWVGDVAHSGETGDEMASVNSYDAIVLDWLLPDRDGIAVCRSLRASGLHVPILLLTARDAVEDRVLGLNAGA